MNLQDKAMKALREAIAQLIKEKRKNKRPLIVWKNGKVVKLWPHKDKSIK